jgi:predicted acyltransferase
MKVTESKRWLSLDVFRGITIALMILVNSPGNQTSYAWLEHSAWDGCTLADLVFPFFLFIVGVSLAFSLTDAMNKAVRRSELVMKITKRAIIIFLLGLLLNAFPDHFNFTNIRYYGVLQRIAVCYFFAALLFISVSARVQALLIITILVGYYALMTQIPVPGFGAGDLSQAGNVAEYFDRLLFASTHLYKHTFDPEGTLSTLPAIATTLLGNLTGVWLLSKNSLPKKIILICSGSVLSVIAGLLWNSSFPINKTLWSSSYVLFTAGCAGLLLALNIWIIEVKRWRGWSLPFKIFGMNAIAVYLLHVFFLKIQAKIFMSGANGYQENLRVYLTDHLFAWTSLPNASLLYAISYTLLWLGVLTLLYRRGIFLKI